MQQHTLIFSAHAGQIASSSLFSDNSVRLSQEANLHRRHGVEFKALVFTGDGIGVGVVSVSD